MMTGDLVRWIREEDPSNNIDMGVITHVDDDAIWVMWLPALFVGVFQRRFRGEVDCIEVISSAL